MLLPIAILAVWGAVYLRQVFSALESPAVPIRMAYLARGGPIVISAESYMVDLARGYFEARRVGLRGPRGEQLALVDRMSVTGLDFLHPDRLSLHIRASGVTGEITRSRTGTINLERVLPSPHTKPQKIPFEVVVLHARLRVVDEMGKRPWRHVFKTERVDVAGMGADWIATALADAGDLGHLPVRIQRIGGVGLRIVTRLSGQNLAPTLAHFLTAPPLRRAAWDDFAANSLRVSGPVAVLIPVGPPAAEIRIDSEGVPVTAEGAGVRYRGTRLDRVSIHGFMTTGGIRGRVLATAGGIRADLYGAATWVPHLRGAGMAHVSAPDTGALPQWVRRRIPAKAGFQDARYDGWVAWSADRAFQLAGQARAQAVRWGDDRLGPVVGQVWANPASVRAQLERAEYAGTGFTADLAVDLRARSVAGRVTAPRTDLGAIGRRLGVSGINGVGSVVAAVSGPLSAPQADVSANGWARYRGRAGRPTTVPTLDLMGQFRVAARYVGGRWNLERAIVRGPFGLVAGSGAISPDGTIAVGVTGRDIDPSVFNSDVTGQANFIAQIGGALSHPSATGYAEGYEIAYQNQAIPALAAHFAVDRQHLDLTDVQATRGAARLAANASLQFSDQKLNGTFALTRLQAAEFAGEDVFASLDFDDGIIGGTLERPEVSARVSTPTLFVKGIQLDRVRANLVFDGDMARLTDAEAAVPSTSGAKEGALRGSVTYDVRERLGSADVSAIALPLAELVPAVSPSLALSGTASAQAHIAFDDRGVESATADGQAASLVLQGATVGDGDWHGAYAHGVITGGLRMASGARKVVANNLTFDLDSRQMGGELELTSVRLADVAAIEEAFVPDQPPGMRADWDTVEGDLTLAAAVSGTPEAMSVDVSKMETRNLSFRGIPLGTLTAEGAVNGDRLTLRQLQVGGGVLRLSAHGDVDLNGAVSLSGRVDQAHIADFGVIVPQLAGQTGTASAIFDVSGPAKGPDIRASVDVDGLLLRPGDSPDRAMRASFVVEADGTAQRAGVTGDYFYRGFQGSLEAAAPYRFPVSLPPDGALTGRVVVKDRPLSDLAQLAPGIDRTLSKGSAGGEIDASGTVAHPVFTGGITLQANTLAFAIPGPTPPSPPAAPTPTAVAASRRGARAPQPPRRAAPAASPGETRIQTALRNVTARLTLDGNDIRFTMAADSSMGGRVTADVSTVGEGASRLGSLLASGEITDFLDTGIRGQVALTKFAARQPFPSGTYVTGVADGKVTIQGTLFRPAVAGAFDLSRVDSVIPTLPPAESAESNPVVDPDFNVTFRLADRARLRTFAAELSVSGDGALLGSLSAPAATGNLTVQKGTIRLPASIVRIDPGGTITPAYVATAGTPIVSVDVDLVGRTALTALRYAEIYQRYDITLEIRGDLLKEGGLSLTANSDPGDLSQDRILALLGESTLAENQTPGFTGQSDTEREVRDALASFAVPSLADPITSLVAREFGLDYLNVEYNTYEQTTAVFAKSLAAGFSIQGRRQIGDPPPGFRSIYDLRLVYSPRRARGFLKQFSLSFGADQNVPWKFDLNYGFKF